MARIGDLTVRIDHEGGAVRDTAFADNPPGWFGVHRHLVLFVHGFNNSFDQAQGSYNAVFTGVLADAVHFFWPGDTRSNALVDAASYPVQITSARDSAVRLVAFLSQLRGPDNTPAEVSFVCHSLGSRLVLEALREVVATGVTFPAVRVVALMAAAVPVDLLQPGAVLEAAARHARTLAVYYSMKDRVLQFAFPAGQAAAAAANIEAAAYTRAVGRFGEPAGLTPNLSLRTLGHGQYWPSNEVASHVSQFFGAAVARTTPESETPTQETPVAAAPPSRLAALTRRLPFRIPGLG
jgi:esterase/lipase superfamily enzyme